MFARHSILKTLGTLVVAVALLHSVYAGPPLICHPLVVGKGALLPWGDEPGWFAPHPEYDINRLTDDTLRLLSDDAPVLSRMENLRRASIYAYTSDDPRVAAGLLTAVLERMQATSNSEAATALARFDAGFLIEAYRQLGLVMKWGMTEAIRPSAAKRLADDLDALDGYRLVQQAIKLTPKAQAEMEFAASLMTLDSAVAAKHRARAAEGAKPGSLLTANLAR